MSEGGAGSRQCWDPQREPGNAEWTQAPWAGHTQALCPLRGFGQPLCGPACARALAQRLCPAAAAGTCEPQGARASPAVGDRELCSHGCAVTAGSGKYHHH